MLNKRAKLYGNSVRLWSSGHPNVGKSSLMNGLIGKKIVSTSVTPGHTKYYQTYYLTKTVKLCDSPGLVFPSLIDKQMQVRGCKYVAFPFVALCISTLTPACVVCLGFGDLKSI